MFLLDSIASTIENYGWYLFIIVLLVAYAFVKAKPFIEEFLKKRADDQYYAKYHKNPDLYAERLAAQQHYVEQLQSKYNVDAGTYEEQLKKKKEEKLQDLHAKYADPTGSGQRLGGASSSQQPNKPKSFKPEYNPLMGDNSRGYRPQKKSCPGGGCGR